jgi:hypothetical protein
METLKKIVGIGIVTGVALYAYLKFLGEKIASETTGSEIKNFN